MLLRTRSGECTLQEAKQKTLMVITTKTKSNFRLLNSHEFKFQTLRRTILMMKNKPEGVQYSTYLNELNLYYYEDRQPVRKSRCHLSPRQYGSAASEARKQTNSVFSLGVLFPVNNHIRTVID